MSNGFGEMPAHMDQSYLKMGVERQSANSTNWTIDVSDIKTVRVSNISLAASYKDIQEFFSFSGDVAYIEIRRESESSQVAYVTFKDPQGADTAVLLTGATIVDHPISVMLEGNYQLPLEAYRTNEVDEMAHAVKKAEDVMSSMLAKGFVLGKDALMRAKSFDERHGLTSNASATVASLDRRIGLSEKICIGTAAVNDKVREVDKKFQVSQMTRLALAAAEQTASSAGAAIMSNPYVLTGTSWMSTAFNKFAKAAGDVGSMTREKVGKAQEDKLDTLYRDRTGLAYDYAQLHLDDWYGETATIPAQIVARDERRKVGNV